MSSFCIGTLLGFALAGLLFQFVPSANLFGVLEFSKKSIIEHNCGGYTRDGKFEWYSK